MKRLLAVSLQRNRLFWDASIATATMNMFKQPLNYTWLSEQCIFLFEKRASPRNNYATLIVA